MRASLLWQDVSKLQPMPSFFTMSKLFKNTYCKNAIILGITLTLAKSAVAADTLKIPQSRINQYAQEVNTAPPTTPVPARSDASDRTKQNRTEVRSPSGGYGCLKGSSSDTFQGNRPVGRYEFAAGMNACNNQLNRLLDNNRANFATKQDVGEISNQLERSRVDLENLRNRVDRLEGQIK